MNNLGSKIKDSWKLIEVFALLVKETEKAVLVDFSNDFDNDEKTWIPKSLIKAINADKNGEFGNSRVFELPMWWAIQNAPRYSWA